jgi:alkylhydroperoxidase family enzyme
MASRLGDSYCTLAWGTKLAEATDPPTAAAVIVGQPSSLMTARDDALASWARKLAVAPNSTTQADVESLRAIGMSDQQIVAASAYVALRVAFSTVNDAIGAVPDRERAEAAPSEVVSAIGFGRPIDQSPSTGR